MIWSVHAIIFILVIIFLVLKGNIGPVYILYVFIMSYDPIVPVEAYVSKCDDIFLLVSDVVNVLVYSQVGFWRKNLHRRDLPLLLTIMHGKGQVMLRGELLVWPFLDSRMDLRLRIPWRSVSNRMTMTHLGQFLGRLLKLLWRPKILIQWYLWLFPQPVSSLVPAKIRLVWQLVWRQPTRVVFDNSWIRSERHRF